MSFTRKCMPVVLTLMMVLTSFHISMLDTKITDSFNQLSY